MLRDAQPGDVYSLDVDPDETPCLGDRFSVVTSPAESAEGPLETGLVQDDSGRWEVVRVGSSSSSPGMVGVSIRAR